MAVYTEVSDGELAAFLAEYDVGKLRAKTPILEGVENSNYRIDTTAGSYVLTLFERRVQAEDLPFFMALMTYLAQKGLPAAAPIGDRSGTTIKTLAGRPAALIRFMPGAPAMAPAGDHCAALGDMLARWHVAISKFPRSRPNPLSLAGWRNLADACRERADECAPGLGTFIDEELAFLSDRWPKALPAGVVHADLFPDNVLFEGGRISGLIDFYFSATDFFAYDLAVCVNSWCFNAERNFIAANAAAMIAAYRKRRPVNSAEAAAFPALLRGAALRFLLTRLYDWLNQVEGAIVAVKDPIEYRDIGEVHRAHAAPAAYGFS